MANRGVEEIVAHYAKIIADLPELPIVIGHSLGGLIAQILLGRNLASGGIAIDAPPMKGVKEIPFSSLKASFPFIKNPFNVAKALSNTYEQFRYGFANAIPEEEARELYERWTIPAPCRPIFQVALATIAGAESKVDTENIKRGPLLITAGEKDHHIPPVFSKASVKKYNSSVITDYKLFENRGHSLTIDNGWKEVAEYSFDWLKKNGL
jgi:pimeloyl-ACP methyl ester carboxylesterase